MLKKICREIIKKALEKETTKKDFVKIKDRISRKYKTEIPKNSKILEFTSQSERKKLISVLLKKPTRSISGISVVAVMARPYKCPHGVCDYCPKGKEAPQSYTGEEPAARRAIMNKFDSFKQTKNRLHQLSSVGHPIDKVELIVMGGTFPAQPFSYQKKFVKGCLDAMIPRKGKTFSLTKKLAEKSKIRPIGITIETRPDFCKEKEINRILSLGGTRVELGVQTIYNSIYRKVSRGHTIEDVVEATQLLKDSGIKVLYQMMPGLPGSNKEKDLEVLKKIFTDERFKPDMLKIYPTLVLKDTKLYDLWKKGKYKPLSSKEATKVIAKAKKFFPKWVRIMRITRDIPANLIQAGVKKSDLRELVKSETKKLGIRCKCIRCREVGHKLREGVLPENIEIKVERYKASNGTEFFISAEDFNKEILIGYLRLRFTSEGKAMIRELHVYGHEVKLGTKAKELEFQHRGFGKKLLKKAEEISAENGKKEIFVLSGIGAKEYYRKLGYKDKGIYMYKNLETYK